MIKDATITFRLPADLKAELERIAQEEDRTLSKVVERILIDALPPRRRPATKGR
jgi:predicted transcriptional regulator